MHYHIGTDFDPNQFALILDKIPVGITVVDLKGHIQYYIDGAHHTFHISTK